MWITLSLASALAAVPADDAPSRPASLQGEAGALILEHVGVTAEVQAGLGVVEVTHTFRNPFTQAIDATYVFPLPADAAVRHMALVAGDLRLEARIDTKDAARAAYEKARQEGRKASLLEQQRDNVFTQEVAAICAGETVRVTVQYVQQIPYEDGVYSFALPTTMGERYDPGDLTEPPLVGSTVPGRDLDVLLSIDEGLPVGSLWSDTHAIRVLEEDSLGTVLDVGPEARPNGDVVVEWTLHADQPRAAMVVSPDGDSNQGTFALSIEPQILEDLVQQQKRELLFVLDSSCSMAGSPWGAAVATVSLALDKMERYETFNLVKFSDAAGSLFATPQPATAANVERAKAWLGRFEGGGTQMDAGVLHSLDMPGDPEALRLVLLLTDGYIGSETELFDVVDKHLGDARLFSLGVGSSVNRLLLDGLARIGRGDVTYQLPDTPTDLTVAAFYDRIAHPSMTDVRVDYGGLQVSETTGRIPDLWVGQPVRVVGRYQGQGEHVVTVRGRVAGQDYALRVPVNLDQAEVHEAVPVLWARSRIGEWKEELRRGDSTAERRITELALAHHLVTDTTSLVATAASPSACATGPVSVSVPALAPVGVEVAESAGVLGARMGAKGIQVGSGGLGSQGLAIGGGGIASSLGSGTSGYGTGLGGNGAVRASSPQVTASAPVVLGSLDASLIQAVIKRHMNGIRYCYQRELNTDPTLAGKLVVKFVIAADGSVSSASIKSSTLNSAAVEACVVGRFQRMLFPAPGGGGIVIVSYPLQFERPS